jgi:hypothetical protein
MPAVRTHTSPWSDSDQNRGSPSPVASNGGNSTHDPSRSRSPRFSEEYYLDNSSSDEDEDDDDDVQDSKSGGDINGGDISEMKKLKKREKRKKFQEARKAHYGMKEALQKAKELLENEAEDDEELGDIMVEEKENDS